MTVTDMARVEQAVHDDLQQAHLLAAALSESTYRAGYWERIYTVAWQNAHECGSHRVCIDSEGKHMCVYGHYMHDPEEAINSFYERTYKMPRPVSYRKE